MKSHMHRCVVAASRGLAARAVISTMLLGGLLTVNVHGQEPGVASSAPPPVPAETGYIIKFKVKSGKNADFERAIGEEMASVRTKEPGNVYSDLYHVPGDLQAYVILERYKDKRASKVHTDSAYIKKLKTTMQSSNLLDAPPDVEPLVYMRWK